MGYRLYTTSSKAWGAMLQEIEKAARSIYLEMYIFLDDTGYDFREKLEEKARQGVRVIMVLDALGSSGLKKESIEAIRKSGIELLFFSDWLRHTHRKILIIDDKVAFIGGVNIGRQFSAWKDIQLKLRGRMVKSIGASFAYSYEMAGGADPHILAYRKRAVTHKLRTWFLDHWPARGMFSLKNHYIKKISGAKKSIVIVSPYFTPQKWFVALIDSAIRRGVKVEIIVPKKTDKPLIDRVNHRYMYELSRMGAIFYLSKEMNHSKAMLIDDEEGLIGSQNIDFLSFRFNAESGVFFRQKNMVAELGKIIRQWKKEADLFKPEKYKMSLKDYIIFPIIKLAYHLL